MSAWFEKAGVVWFRIFRRPFWDTSAHTWDDLELTWDAVSSRSDWKTNNNPSWFNKN